MNKILFNDLKSQWRVIKDPANDRIETLFDTSAFINGPDVSLFESNFAKFIGTQHAVGTSNGTDAIKLCVQALELKGETGVIIPANTFIATILGAEMALPDAEFVLIDCDEYYQIDTLKLAESLSENRKRWDNCIIMPVHLYGHACDIEKICKLANEFDCHVIEDCSQAHGTTTASGKRVGSFGDMAAFSMYPGKNLGASGDAGVITTNKRDYYDKIKLLQNWGSVKKYYYERKGYNNRLDTLQAIIVDEKLKHLHQWNLERKMVASWYDTYINNPKIIKPKVADYCGVHTYHIYCVRLVDIERDSLIKKLNDNSIQCGIHYPVPIEETTIYKGLGFNNPKTREYSKQLLSLPMHPFLEKEDVMRLIKILNEV